MIPPETVSTENREPSSSDHSLNRSLHSSLQEKSRKRLRTKSTKETSRISFVTAYRDLREARRWNHQIQKNKKHSGRLASSLWEKKTEQTKAEIGSINNPYLERRKQRKKEAIRTLCEGSWREEEERGRQKGWITDTTRCCHLLLHLLQLVPHRRSHCRSSRPPWFLKLYVCFSNKATEGRKKMDSQSIQVLGDLQVQY